MSQRLLSLCIPTNGIPELVFPVLESIYSQQNLDFSLFEVVVMDNGQNKDFKKEMSEYLSGKENLVYRETGAPGFLNEAEAYKTAEGIFIKFINHRTKLLTGTIDYFLRFVKKNLEEKPCVYFGNGVIPEIKGVAEYKTFDEYVAALSYWSSWSTGMGFWKEDFDRIPANRKFNTLFPHTTILFSERGKKRYILDNSVLLSEIPVSHANKGKYNVFYAFAVEYPAILSDLLRDGDISKGTFLKVKKENFGFLLSLYFDFVVLKRPHSYDLSDYKNSFDVFYSSRKLKLESVLNFFSKSCKKILSLLHK